MSAAISPCAGGFYSASDDSAVSSSGEELRTLIRAALAPPSDPPGSSPEALLRRVNEAIKKGYQREGVLVDAEAVGRMFDVIRTLPRGVPLPEIVVESGTEIGLDWNEGSRRTLSLTITNTPFVGYAALMGYEPIHGRALFAGRFPKTLAFLFSQIYSDKHDANV